MNKKVYFISLKISNFISINYIAIIGALTRGLMFEFMIYAYSN